MENNLRTLLEAMKSGTAAYHATLSGVLERLSAMSDADLKHVFASIAADLDELRQKADDRAESYLDARTTAAVLEQCAERFRVSPPTASGLSDRPSQSGSSWRISVPKERTRAAILEVMAQEPHSRWTPQLVHEALRGQGKATGVGRTAVQSALWRLAADGEIEKCGHGSYQLGGPTASNEAPLAKPRQAPSLADVASRATQARYHKPWLTPEIVNEVADDSVSAFLTKHPSEDDRKHLNQVAMQSIVRWTERHGFEPDDRGHVARLMKTALYDIHRRKIRAVARVPKQREE